MTKKTRNILFLIFILLFLILFPVILALANGYRFNLSRPIRLNTILQKTGMFIINTKPSGAEIYINGEPIAENKKFSGSAAKTPAKIKTLLPGKYTIELFREGYYPWKKELEIRAGESTFAEDIYLIKTDIPINLLSRKIDLLKLSPDKKTILSIGETVDLINIENNNQINNVSNSLKEINYSEWSSDGKKFFINNKIYSSSDNFLAPLDLEKNFSEELSKLKWADGSNKIYFKGDGAIFSYEIGLEKISKIYERPNIQDYLIMDNFLFLIINDDEKIQFRSLNLDNNEETKSFELPFSAEYEFIESIDGRLNILDKKYQLFYQINPFSNFNPIQEVISNIKIFKWISPAQMLYANDFEIWIADLNSSRKTLLTRVSHKITDIAWHPNNNYVLYSTQNKLNIIELDNRERRSITEIGSYNDVNNLEINRGGGELYFNAKIGNQQGLYKLIIN